MILDGKELLKRKECLEKELEYLNSKIEYSESVDEVCLNCNHYYASGSECFLMFEHYDTESNDPEQAYVNCFICKGEIKRHPSFINTLNLVRDDTFITNLLNEHSNHLTRNTLSVLITMITNISVPSFFVKIKSEHGIADNLEELNNLNYIRVMEMSDKNYLTVILNARKLKLYDRLDILDTISVQKQFNYTYSYNKNKRYERLNKLENNFSNDDKSNLLDRFNHRCAFTGKEVNLHMDHVIPVSWEIEGTTVSNMLPICGILNSSKHDSNVFEWYKKNGEKYEVKEHLFIDAMSYIAELNDMTLDEYESYVYECEENKK